MKNPTIHTTDSFKSAFTKFQQSTDFNRLQEKFELRSFYDRNRHLKQTASFTSYLLNVLSAVTASACIYFFFSSMIPFVSICALLTGCVVLVIEAFKRLTLPSLFKRYLQFKELSIFKIVFILVLMLCSAFLSYNGAHQLVTVCSKQTDLISIDSINNHFAVLIATNQAKQDELKRTHSWKGKLTREGQKTYTKIESQNSELQTALLIDTQTAKDDNSTRLMASNQTTGQTAGAFALISLLLDFTLCLCLWYVEFYDFRSFAEFASIAQPVQNDDQQNNHKPVETSSTATQTTDHQPLTDDRQTLSLAIKQAQANIRAYTHKQNNSIGNRDTNERGLSRWMDTLDQLNKKISVST